ncbi:hypothetical protein V6Z11_A10G061900 [Gossypium hirsutum]
MKLVLVSFASPFGPSTRNFSSKMANLGCRTEGL